MQRIKRLFKDSKRAITKIEGKQKNPQHNQVLLKSEA